MKVCSKCKAEKTLDCFKVDKRKLSGRGAICKLCANKQESARSAAPEKKARRHAAYLRRVSDPSYRAAMLNYGAAFRASPEGRAYYAAYERERRANDPLYALMRRVRNLVKESVRAKGVKKNSRTQQVLGCSVDFFRLHIEAQFVPGMSWSNFGEWQLDHITPQTSAATSDDIFRLNHYSNFQPLWGAYNRAKSNRSPEEWQEYIKINNINLEVKP